MSKHTLGTMYSVFGIKILNSVVILITSAIITRILSPENAGIYFLIYSLAAYVGVICRIGSGQAVLKFVSQFNYNNEGGGIKCSILKTSQITGLGFILAIIIITLCKSYLITYNKSLYEFINNNLYVCFILIFCISYQAIISQSLRGSGRTTLGVFADNTSAMILFVLVLGLLNFFDLTATLDDIVALLATSYFLALLSSSIILFYVTYNSNNIGFIETKQIFKFCMSAFVINIVNVSISETALHIAAFVLTTRDLAVFGASFRFVKSMFLPLMIVNIVVEPLIVKFITSKETKELEKLLRGAATLAAIPSVAAMFLLILFGDYAMSFVFGDFYSKSHNIVVVMSIGYIVNVITGPCGALLIMSGNEKVAMHINVFMLLVSIILAFFFMKYFDGLGVAAGFSVGMIIGNITLLTISKKRLGIYTSVSFSYNDILASIKYFTKRYMVQ